MAKPSRFALTTITARIADHPGPVSHIVAESMDMAVNPNGRPSPRDQVGQITSECRIGYVAKESGVKTPDERCVMRHDESATCKWLFQFAVNIRPALDVALKDFLNCDQPVFVGLSLVGSKDTVEVHYPPW
ncbi:hypothetical protein ACCT19_33425, partial [Rhizobium ruizarguesonis]